MHTYSNSSNYGSITPCQLAILCSLCQGVFLPTHTQWLSLSRRISNRSARTELKSFSHLQYLFLQCLIISVLFWDVGDSAAVSPPPVVNNWEPNRCLPHFTSLWQTHHYASAHPRAFLAQTKTVNPLSRAFFICKMPIYNDNFPFFLIRPCFVFPPQMSRLGHVLSDLTRVTDKEGNRNVKSFVTWMHFELPSLHFFVNISSSKTL